MRRLNSQQGLAGFITRASPLCSRLTFAPAPIHHRGPALRRLRVAATGSPDASTIGEAAQQRRTSDGPPEPQPPSSPPTAGPQQTASKDRSNRTSTGGRSTAEQGRGRGKSKSVNPRPPPAPGSSALAGDDGLEDDDALLGPVNLPGAALQQLNTLLNLSQQESQPPSSAPASQPPAPPQAQAVPQTDEGISQQGAMSSDRAQQRARRERRLMLQQQKALRLQGQGHGQEPRQGQQEGVRVTQQEASLDPQPTPQLQEQEGLQQQNQVSGRVGFATGKQEGEVQQQPQSEVASSSPASAVPAADSRQSGTRQSISQRKQKQQQPPSASTRQQQQPQHQPPPSQPPRPGRYLPDPDPGPGFEDSLGLDLTSTPLAPLPGLLQATPGSSQQSEAAPGPGDPGLNLPPVPDYFSMSLGGITQPPTRPAPASHLLGPSLIESLDKLRGVVPVTLPQGGTVAEGPQAQEGATGVEQGSAPPAPVTATQGGRGGEPQQVERRGSRGWREALRQAQAGLPWLFNTQAVRSGLSQELREDYAVALQRALPLLATYDISSPQGRNPHVPPNPAMIEPSLAARAVARWEAANRLPKPAVEVPSITLPVVLDQGKRSAGGSSRSGSIAMPMLGVVEDGGWSRKQKQQAAYLDYMRELLPVLIPGVAAQQQQQQQQQSRGRAAGRQGPRSRAPPADAGSSGQQQEQEKGVAQQGQQQQVTQMGSQGVEGQSAAPSVPPQVDAQLAYQVGICDDWLQLSHMLSTFSPHGACGPLTLSSMLRRLGELLTPRSLLTWGAAERTAFTSFFDQLCTQAAGVVGELTAQQLCASLYGLALVTESRRSTRPPPGPSAALAPAASVTADLPAGDNSTGAGSQGRAGSSRGSAVAELVVRLPGEQAGNGDELGLQQGVSSKEDEATVLADPSLSPAVAHLVHQACGRAEELLQVRQTHWRRGSPALTSEASIPEHSPNGASSLDSSSTQLDASSTGASSGQQQQQQGQGQGEAAASSSGGGGGKWGPEQLYQLCWSLGALGVAPPSQSLMGCVCSASFTMLENFTAPQLCGLLWGLARLGHVPERIWAHRYLAASQRVMRDFDTPSLGRLVWSASTLQLSPDRPWLRAVCGALNARSRSLLGPTLVQVMTGLCNLGYKPREEISRALLGQLSRQLHTLTPTQLATLLHAMAIATGWAPYKQFYYDYASLSRPKLRLMTPLEAASVMWGFARLGLSPDRSYLEAAAAAVARASWALADGEAVSLSLWALATLPPHGHEVAQELRVPGPASVPGAHALQGRQAAGASMSSTGRRGPGRQKSRPAGAVQAEQGGSDQEQQEEEGVAVDEVQEVEQALMRVQASSQLGSAGGSNSGTHEKGSTSRSPLGLGASSSSPRRGIPTTWLVGCLVRLHQVAPTLSAPAVANTFTALSELGVQPPSYLVDALLLRASRLMAEFSGSEMSDMVAALARLQYRPSDAWLKLFTQQASTQFAGYEGSDWGLTLWGLGAIGSPVTEGWLKALCRSASRKWYSHSGEGLALLAIGLAQYNYSAFRQQQPQQSASSMPAKDKDSLDDGAQLESEWWGGYFKEVDAKWQDIRPPHLVGMAVAVAQLVEDPPDREWQRGLVRALRKSITRPSRSSLILPTILAAGGMLPAGTAISLDPGAVPADITAKAGVSGADTQDQSPAVNEADSDATSVEDANDSRSQSQPLPSADALLAERSRLTLDSLCPDPAMRKLLPEAARQRPWFVALLHELRRQWAFPAARA